MRSAFVTGSEGSVARALIERLERDGVECYGYDVKNNYYEDVCDSGIITSMVHDLSPEVVFHLAGAKYAQVGEESPEDVARTNIIGTINAVDAARDVGAKGIVASTCKAVCPETVYGATKLVAERIALNAGQSVARFYNVRESSGNVFEIWRGVPEDQPLPVTPCQRYFLSMEQAVDLLVAVAQLPSGRYTIDPGPRRHMAMEARAFAPGREQRRIPPRVGDRLIEPRYGQHERLVEIGGGIEQIISDHDAVREQGWTSAA